MDDDILKTELRGSALLQDPLLNKGTAFSREERSALELNGLLPRHVSSLEQQVERTHAHISRKTDDLEKYIGLAGLQDRNEHLFYRLLLDHIEELLPIVYTPTVGRAALEFSHIFRRARGLWITPDHRGRIDEVLGHAPVEDVRLIVVTDNERILGLGDQGAGGMTIPVGKLALYTVAAGIHPSRCLPISLDVGTQNQRLLDDPLYLGWRHDRLRGPEYDDLIEEFVTAVQARFPKALLQWEDFKKVNAINLLERHRKRLLSFNDDIQGTAGVALAGVLAGVRALRGSLADQRFVILGAGAAGIGIGHQIRDALIRSGSSHDEAGTRIGVLDSRGLLVEGREMRAGEEYKLAFAWPKEAVDALGLPGGEPADLLTIVRQFRPTVLIGTSGQAGAFPEEVVREMANGAERPLIFPFSNPTSKSEATPEDLTTWTDGRALIATGSPFPPVSWRGETRRIGQGNNVFIFPGVGLGVLVAQAREVTDSMFTAAAEMLASQISDEALEVGELYPRLTELRHVTAEIAAAVVREAAAAGVAESIPDEEIPRRVNAAMWEPSYPEIQPV